jgi:hypothetical protein
MQILPIKVYVVIGQLKMLAGFQFVNKINLIRCRNLHKNIRSHLKNTSPRVRLRFSKPNPESKRAFEGLRLTASSIFEMASRNMPTYRLF